jgi:5-methylcytosine-specific restriction endonuclease McrA
MALLRWNKSDEELLARVRVLQVSKTTWSTSHQEIIDFRERLLKLQKNRCAYCQATIESTANGFVELDHILPKAPNGKDADRMNSEIFEDRLVTPGYAQFMYEPQNLVVTCRACNTSKNSFDPLILRKNSIKEYPDENNVGSVIQWFHPHFHEYEKHITRTPDWTFEHESPEGDFTIRACKLHIPEQLTKRFQARADANLEHSPSVRIAIVGLATSILQSKYGIEQGVRALVKRCKLNESVARNLINAFIELVRSGTPESLSKSNQALQSVAIIWEGEDAFNASAQALTRISKIVEKK